MTALQEKYRLPADVVQEHSLIVDAIEGADAPLAPQRIEDHMQDALIRLVPPPESDEAGVLLDAVTVGEVAKTSP